MRRLTYVLCSAFALSACSQSTVSTGQDENLAPFYQASHKTRVSGFVYDPEAFNWSFNMDPAGGAPLVSLDSGHMLRSLVSGAQVSLLDEDTRSTVGSNANPTDSYGAFVVDVPSDASSPYLASVTADSVALQAPQPRNPNSQPFGPMNPPVPPANYLPTVVLRGISSEQNFCYVPTVPVASDAGILQAVAKFYTTVLGVPTTVSDFLDPTKFGGVVIWSLSPAIPWNIVFTASDTGSAASVGDTFNLTWAPPNDPSLPPEAVAIQSDRGYIVSPDNAYNNGISVTLLPPSSQPTSVTLHSTDYTNDSTQLRPYTFADKTFLVSPGVVSYGFQLPDLGPDRITVDPGGNQVPLPLPDFWRCVSDIDQDL